MLTCFPAGPVNYSFAGVSACVRSMPKSESTESLRTDTPPSELLLAAIIDSSEDAIISKNLDGVITSWNAAAERIYGYQASEIIGQSITVLIPPDRLDEEQELLARIRRGERIDHFSTMRVRKDGGLIGVSITISPIKDSEGRIIGASKIAGDVTEQQRTIRAAQHLAAIVDSSDDAIISKDLDGIITSWNQAAERIFGYTEEEMIGKPITWLIPAERAAEEPAILERLRRGERADHFETVRVRKTGEKIDVSLTISPIKDASGKIIGASKIARDITEQKRIVPRPRPGRGLGFHFYRLPPLGRGTYPAGSRRRQRAECGRR
jgi:two-component system NtrC family sensor kinase